MSYSIRDVTSANFKFELIMEGFDQIEYNGIGALFLLPAMRFTFVSHDYRAVVMSTPIDFHPTWFNLAFLKRVYQLVNHGSLVQTPLPKPGNPIAFWCEQRGIREWLRRHNPTSSLTYDITCRIQIIRNKGKKVPLLWIEKLGVSHDYIVQEFGSMYL